MEKLQKRKVQILPPVEFTGLKEKEPSKTAAGIAGITHAIEHLSEEMGLLKGLKVMSKVNQVNGIDCPGCAWPDPKHRSALGEYCENGAKAIAEEATTKVCDEEFFKQHSVEELSTWSDYHIGKAGRVIYPMYLKAGSSHYERISWDQAFERIAQKLKELEDPDEAVFYTSGRTSNEAAYAYQLMTRKYGTNNMPDCSNMCHESSGVGLSTTVGIGKGSVTLEDLYESELILVMGQNPGTNHPRMLSAMQKCKKNGGKIIHINPLPEVGTTKFVDPQSPVDILTGGTKIADHFLQLKINGDIALLKYMMWRLKQLDDAGADVFDKAFIEEYTEGADAFLESINSWNGEQLLEECGLTTAEVEPVVKLLAEKKKIIVCWAMGITQHHNGVDNVKEIVNLLLLKGAIGKPGAGTCPVRGHSNVQGDRTMGIYEKPSDAFLDSIEGHFNFKAPREHGYDVVDSISAMAEGKVKVFFAMGGNFISATPDSEVTGKAVQNCDLTVQVSTKLNRAHLVTGNEAIILPCLGRTEIDNQESGEQFVSVENSMGVVHSSRGYKDPASSELRSEVAIVCDLATCLFGANDEVNWKEMKGNYDLIRDHIEATIPGFDRYNERVREKQGFLLPNVARDRSFLKGKAHFSSVPLPQVAPKEGKFILMTIRSHDQFNTTIYGLDDRYRGVLNERRILFIHPDDAKEEGLAHGDIVDIHGHYNGELRKAEKFIVKPYSIARGCLATYFPEANSLVPLKSVARESNTPASKFVEVSLKKVD